MKAVILISLLLLSACATRSDPVLTGATQYYAQKQKVQ